MSAPDPVSDSAQAVAKFHSQHDREASALQRLIDRLTDLIGRPWSVALMIGLGLGWLIADMRNATQPMAEYGGVELWGTLTALFVGLLILSTQRRDDQLAERRARLMLELALLADRRDAKLVSLFEELRRDAPNLVDRRDAESEEMAKPSDPEMIVREIDRRADAG